MFINSLITFGIRLISLILIYKIFIFQVIKSNEILITSFK